MVRSEHLVKYLSSRNANLSFGAQYDSLPVASIASIAYDIAAEQGGLKQAFIEAGQSVARDAMELGFGNLDQMLDANMQRYFGAVLDARLNSHISSLYTKLRSQWTANPATFQTEKLAIIDQYCNPVTGHFVDRLKNLADDSNGLIEQTIPKVDSALAAVDAVMGLFAETGGKRTIASQLAFQFLRHIDPGFTEELQDVLQLGGDALDDKFNEYLAPYDQPLDQIHAALTELRNGLVLVRNSLNVGGEFAHEMDELFLTHQAELQQVVTAVGQELIDYFEGLHPGDYPFNDLTFTDARTMIRAELDDRFYGTSLASAMHAALKHRLYDVDAAVREATDTAFAQMNFALRDLVNFALTKLDNKIDQLLGDVGGVMSAGKLSGYAHINGDSLKLLRLDASAVLRVPEEMGFQAYFQIKELDSDGTPTECLPASGRATEVTLGAKDVKLSFIQSNLTATVGGKFTFDTGPANDPHAPVLVTMGGNIDIGGSLKFGPVEITRIHAGLAFGTLENYITAGASAKVKGYSGSGGFFMGKSCTLGFLSWDPEVEAVLGTTLPFTGAYAYGEVWIPISEVLFGIPASCMFQVSGGIGLGAGFFLEGPTFVGKGLLGLDGDFLCVASLNCTMKLAGKANPDGLVMRGKGSFEVELGPCPLCASVSKDLIITFQNGEWDAEF